MEDTNTLRCSRYIMKRCCRPICIGVHYSHWLIMHTLTVTVWVTIRRSLQQYSTSTTHNCQCFWYSAFVYFAHLLHRVCSVTLQLPLVHLHSAKLSFNESQLSQRMQLGKYKLLICIYKHTLNITLLIIFIWEVLTSYYTVYTNYYFNKIYRICYVNTHIWCLKVWLKSMIPLLKYRIFF